MIPKANKPGKWRLIVDLSYPEGQNVNDVISSADASMIYSSIDDAARLILDSGEGALLAKIDVASAFRIIPVHPDDRHLLGMLWKGQAYIDKQLPFGLRSAPMLFNGYADALEWILREHGFSRVIHYLDDFLVVGSAHSTQCAGFLSTMLQVCDDLGISLWPLTRLKALQVVCLSLALGWIVLPWRLGSRRINWPGCALNWKFGKTKSPVLVKSWNI